MGRGVSAGGGQSSLGYLFGTGDTTNNAQVSQNQEPVTNKGPSQKTAAASQPIDKQIPAGVQGHLTNNYFRADGQNCGNFITNIDGSVEMPMPTKDRPSTKVHSAPGGGSSLGYLFGGGGN